MEYYTLYEGLEEGLEEGWKRDTPFLGILPKKGVSLLRTDRPD
jgi:hypothetical protein